MSVITPLYGHVSEDTAYLVNDYPYSFKLRCKIRYWIEAGKKGFRFCSQTSNPKKGDIWNAPKKSTYSLLIGCMYLDENGHVQWSALNEYSDAQKFLDFFQNFPGIQLDKDQADRLKFWLAGKITLCKRTSGGEALISINNVPQLPSEEDIEKAKKELEIWEKVKIELMTILHKF